MSELVVTSTEVRTGVLAGTLVAALGVGVGRLISGLASQALDTERTVSASAIGDSFRKSARAAEARMQAEYAQLRQEMTGGSGPSPSLSVFGKLAAEGIASARGITAAFQDEPLMAAAAEALDTEGFRRARCRLDQVDQVFRLGSMEEAARLAGEAAASMRDLVRASAQRLAEAQRVVVAEQVRQALPQLGYQVTEAGEGGATAFRAARAAQMLGVVVVDGGQLIVDTAGFEGMRCRDAVEALFRCLREKGVATEIAARYAHQRPDGGPLLARGGPAGLLDGVRDLRSSVKPSRARKAAADDGRRRVVAGLAMRGRQERPS